jgi:hypothetical protein
MYEEKNTANNMPAQCEIYAEGDDAYKFHVHGQGRRFRQQELSVPGDAVGADERRLLAFLKEKVLTLGYRGVPPISPCHRDRRHFRRTLHEDRASLHPRVISRAADPGFGGRQCRSAISRWRQENPEDDAVARRRRAVRRQVFLPTTCA